jgi:hypothetical protein
MYILSTNSLNEDDYKIDPRVNRGLPIVVASYGKVMAAHWSAISVRHKGSMDTGLWHQLLKDVYVPLYEGRISPEPIRDPVTMKLLSGPLIVKTDAGPGRLSKQAISIDFREEMAQLGVHILLSLPNGTSCTAEMDQLFEKFKPACSKSALRVASKKMQKRMLARKKSTSKGNSSDGESADGENELVEEEKEVEVVEAEEEEEVEVEKKRQSICNVSFSNFDLGNLVNGWPEDPVELRPFDFHFKKERIIKTWKAVGFLQMTGNATKDPKVRYEMGEGGAPDDATNRLDHLRADYRKSAETLTEMGFNGAMFDIEPPVVSKDVIPEGNEAKIQHIIDNRLINKAGGLYKTGLIIANAQVVLEAAKRIAVLDAKAKAKAELKKTIDVLKRDGEAQKAHREWVCEGRLVNDDGNPKLNRKSAHAIVRFLLPRVDIKGELKMKDFNSMKACVKWLGEVKRGMTWDEHMHAAAEEKTTAYEEMWRADNENFAVGAAPLFELGSV